MAEGRLGLFDKPPGRKQVAHSLMVVALLFAAFLLVLPVRNHRLPEVSSFIPMVTSVNFVADLITATLLYGQATVFRSRGLTVIGAAYIYSALVLIPFVLAFPGAFSADGLLSAGLNTTPWLAFLRRAAFPIAVLLYVYLRRRDSVTQAGSKASPTGIRTATVTAIGLALAVSVLATVGHDLLPPFYANRAEPIYSYAVIYEAVFFAVSSVAMVVLFRSRHSSLDVWLLVAFSGGMIQSLLIFTLESRFTVGWYCLYVVNLISHLVVMLVLISESNRLYMRLALSTAAGERAREARLMSLNAMAASITHEAGQPVAAVALNASTALNWLTRRKPEVARAIASLHDTLEAARRSKAVIKSIQSMFGSGADERTEFSLNDLVRETAPLLARELASEKALLELELDEALPPILGDRTQIQRVLVNLVMNAIEELRTTRGHPRRIVMRSEAALGGGVLLTVSDTGHGIAPDARDTIFESFVTTKAGGTGLGLSLSRMIVREHGGDLRASEGPLGGATLHLELPGSRLH